MILRDGFGGSPALFMTTVESTRHRPSPIDMLLPTQIGPSMTPICLGGHGAGEGVVGFGLRLPPAAFLPLRMQALVLDPASLGQVSGSAQVELAGVR